MTTNRKEFLVGASGCNSLCFTHQTSKIPLKLAPDPSRPLRQELQIVGKLNFKASSLLLYFSSDAWTEGLWLEGAQTREGEERRLFPDRNKHSVLNCFWTEKLNCDWFARYAVRRSLNQCCCWFKKGTFHNFLPIAKWTSPLKRYRNRTVVRHFFKCGVSPRGIFNETEVGWCFLKVEYFLKSKKHVTHDSILCSYLVLRFSVRLSSSLKLVLGLFKWIGGARFRFFSF